MLSMNNHYLYIVTDLIIINNNNNNMISTISIPLYYRVIIATVLSIGINSLR